MDERARAWGDAAARAVRAAYERLGYFVVPTYAIEDGGAPMLTGLIRKHVLPDMMLSHAGRSAWREVKFKDHCVLYNKTGFYRHGIDLPKWHAYRKVEQETGIPGGIAILQFRRGAKAAPEPCLLEQTFEVLASTVDLEPAPLPHAPAGMAYWNVDEMDRICWLDFEAPSAPRLTQVIHAWEQKTKAGQTPQMSLEQQRSLFSFNKVDVPRQNKPANIAGFVGYDADGLFVHYCHCGVWGAYGVGVSLRKGVLGTWYCAEHKPRGGL